MVSVVGPLSVPELNELLGLFLRLLSGLGLLLHERGDGVLDVLDVLLHFLGSHDDWLFCSAFQDDPVLQQLSRVLLLLHDCVVTWLVTELLNSGNVLGDDVLDQTVLQVNLELLDL